MPFLGTGGGSLTVKKSHVFADTAARDTYFVTNPSEKVDMLYVTVGNDLYRWDSTAGVWDIRTAIIKGGDGSNGNDGAPASPILLQYSNDGSNGWSSTQQAGSKYWRWSTNNGSTWSSPVVFKLDEAGGSPLPDPFYYQKDLDGNLTIRAVFNGVDQEILKFGSIESDELKYNKAMGGLRYVHPDGTEYFAVRTSPNGDGKSLVFGNYDTVGPNYLATSETGFVEAILTSLPTAASVAFTTSTNVLGGTRFEVIYTAVGHQSIREIIVNSTSNVTTKFNTFITNTAGDVLFSDHQNKDEYEKGFGSSKFTKSIVAGTNTLLLSQPFPLLDGNSVRIVYDFDQVVNLTMGTMFVKGFELRLGRVLSASSLTQAQIAALPSSEKYEGRIVRQTDGEVGYYVYQGGAWIQLGKPSVATNATVGTISAGGGLVVDANGRLDVDVGTGLKLSDNTNTAKVMVDAANLDVTTLKNADTLVSGIYKGALNGSSTLATLANSAKGSWWNVSATVTLDTTTFYAGDQLWCTSTIVGTPANLASFVRVPASSATATSSVYGVVKKASNDPLKAAPVATKGTSDAMASEDHVHPQSEWRVKTWLLSSTYDPDDIVLKDGLFYKSLSAIPANTAFVVFDGSGLPLNKWSPFYWPVKHEGTVGGIGRIGIDDTGFFWETI